MLRGDNAKDDSCSLYWTRLICITNDSSQSHEYISRLPGCAGQAADAVSAYTQDTMEDDPRLLKLPKTKCPDAWIRLPRHKWPKSWSNIEDPVVLLERNLYGHPLAGLLWEKQAIRESSNGTRLGQSSKLGMLCCKPRKSTSLVLCMWTI